APAATLWKPSAGWSKRVSIDTRPAMTSRGWATAVSLIVASSEVVPWATRTSSATAKSDSARSPTPGISSQGVRKPGFWEPWPGQTITSTLLGSPLGRGDAATERHQQSNPELEDSYNLCGTGGCALEAPRARMEP